MPHHSGRMESDQEVLKRIGCPPCCWVYRWETYIHKVAYQIWQWNFTITFLLDDDAYVLETWLVNPYSGRQLSREERKASYRISWGRRLVENALGILVWRFRVLLCTKEQIPKFVSDTALTCVVLHNILRTHQGGGSSVEDSKLETYLATKRQWSGYVLFSSNQTGLITYLIYFNLRLP